jgi:hypothetical protein
MIELSFPGQKSPVMMCHLIITCPSHKGLHSQHSVAQHNIFKLELALTSHDEDAVTDAPHIFQIMNETDLRMHQLRNCCTIGLWNYPLH